MRGCGLVALVAMVATSGCEWLPLPTAGGGADAGADAAARPRGPARLPRAHARRDEPGPLVPRTAGRRVPEGYWTRLRLDQADLWLPHTWIVAEVVPHPEERGERQLLVRMLAVGGEATGEGLPPVPALRVVQRVHVPPDTRVDGLEGMVLEGEALGEGTIGLRLVRRDPWQLEPERLVLSHVGDRLVKGSLSGVARRGSHSEATRSFDTGFLALRAPEPAEPSGTGDEGDGREQR